MSPVSRHELIKRGLAMRRRRRAEKEKAENDLKELKSVKDEYFLDLEAETYLKKVTELLLDEYEYLPNDKRERVLKEISETIGQEGLPGVPMKILVRDVVNRVLGE